MPRNHTGQGTLFSDGRQLGSVRFDVAEEQVSGWTLVRGYLRGDDAILASAYDDNDGHAILRHDQTGFEMDVTIIEKPVDGVALVAVDALSRVHPPKA